MVTKAEIVQELDELGIEFDELSKKADLLELLEKEKQELGITDEEKVESTIPLQESMPEKQEKPLAEDFILVVVSHEQLVQLEKSGKLVGYKPETKEAIIREET